MSTDLNIDLHAVISELSQKIASLVQENAILKAVIKSQQDTLAAVSGAPPMSQ
jgi:uncharacterized small protein (DUF1192 family)